MRRSKRKHIAPAARAPMAAQLLTFFLSLLHGACSLKANLSPSANCTTASTLGMMPWGRFATTYSRDFSERHPQISQLTPRPEAKAAPSFISPPQTDRETWPIFHRYFYKTTNSIYGSGGCSQSSLPLPPFGIVAPFISEAPGAVGSALTEARTQEVEVAKETGPVLGEEKGLRYVFGGKANVLEQQGAKDEAQQKIDVLYEEGVIVLSSHIGPACCEDFLVYREAGPQDLLHLPVAFSPIMTLYDAENWDTSAYLRGLRQAVGLKGSTFLQPTSRQRSCCAWEAGGPNSCCFKVQTFRPGIPRGSMLPLAHVQPPGYSTEPRRKPLLTEYQASYTAEWDQPEIHRCDLHHRHPPRHQILHPSL